MCRVAAVNNWHSGVSMCGSSGVRVCLGEKVICKVASGAYWYLAEMKTPLVRAWCHVAFQLLALVLVLLIAMMSLSVQLHCLKHHLSPYHFFVLFCLLHLFHCLNQEQISQWHPIGIPSAQTSKREHRWWGARGSGMAVESGKQTEVLHRCQGQWSSVARCESPTFNLCVTPVERTYSHHHTPLALPQV